MSGDGMPTRADGAYIKKPDPRADTKPPGPSLEDRLRADYTPIMTPTIESGKRDD